MPNLKEKCAASQRDLTLGCVFKVRLLWEITGRYRLSHLGPAIQLQMCFLLPGKEVAPLPRGCVQSQVCVGIRGLFQGMPGPWMRFPFSLSLQGKSVEIPGGAPQCGEAGKGRSPRLGWTGEADKTQPPLSPLERPLPGASSPPTPCNARCNLASKHRITAN